MRGSSFGVLGVLALLSASACAADLDTDSETAGSPELVEHTEALMKKPPIFQAGGRWVDDAIVTKDYILTHGGECGHYGGLCTWNGGVWDCANPSACVSVLQD